MVTAYLTIEQKREIMSECNDAGLILLEFYVSKQHIDNYNFADKVAANELGWRKQKVQRTRLALEKSGLFKTHKDGNTTVICIGRSQVDKHNRGEML